MKDNTLCGKLKGPAKHGFKYTCMDSHLAGLTADFKPEGPHVCLVDIKTSREPVREIMCVNACCKYMQNLTSINQESNIMRLVFVKKDTCIKAERARKREVDRRSERTCTNTCTCTCKRTCTYNAHARTHAQAHAHTHTHGVLACMCVCARVHVCVCVRVRTI